jgi:cell division protein FtsZ
MIRSGIQGVDFIVANTDAQALNSSVAEERLQLGRHVTQGLGAGAAADVGRAAAEESIADIEQALEGAHMCFVAAGMGGGTGSGAAPVVAAAARAKGILTVGVVTKPFKFEGRRRAAAADAAIEELAQHVDTLIVIPNDNLFRLANPSTTFREAFAMADDVLEQGVRSITDLIIGTGTVNLDFADIRSVMQAGGMAVLGTGEATGDDRAACAAQLAVSNPLLDGSIVGARGLIISIAGGDDMKLMEIDEAASTIKNMVDEDADIIWGSTFDPALEGKIRVSIVVTGIDGERAAQIQSRSEMVVATPVPPAQPALVAMMDGLLMLGDAAPMEPAVDQTAAAFLASAPARMTGEPAPEKAVLTAETRVPAHAELMLETWDMHPEPVLVLPSGEEEDGPERRLPFHFGTNSSEGIMIKAPRVLISGTRDDRPPPSLLQRVSMLARGSRNLPAPRPTIRVEPGVYRRAELFDAKASL